MSVIRITNAVAGRAGFGHRGGTMTRRMLYRIYPLLVALAAGYVVGLLAVKGL